MKTETRYLIDGPIINTTFDDGKVCYIANHSVGLKGIVYSSVVDEFWWNSATIIPKKNGGKNHERL